MYTNLNKWNYSKLTSENYRFYGKKLTYQLGNDFLKDCDIVEDWGSGGGGFLSFRADAVGVDGSASPFTKKHADLVTYKSICDGIFMRHVLEHNYEWKNILDNALNSFTKKMCLITFIPFSYKTTLISFAKNKVPNLSLGFEEFLSVIDPHKSYIKIDYQKVKTNGFSKYEEIFYITKYAK